MGMIEHQTQMFKEAGEAHSKVREQLASNESAVIALVERLRQNPPTLVMICARGSSSNAGVYARYLLETRIQIPVLNVAPSLSSVFSVKHKVGGALFLAISQSGQSPDILSSAQAAKNGGAYLVALVNDEQSPLAHLADLVLPLRAGPETSVAATKTFICTLTAIAQMVAYWGELASVKDGLSSLPEMLKQAFDITWDDALDALEPTESLFVVSRGLGLSIAKEAALKFKETCCVHAEAFSAAEVKHGPMVLVRKGFPAMIFSTGDETQSSIDDVAAAFISRSANVFATGDPYAGGNQLPIISCGVTELRPIIAIQTFYRFINALSIRRGLDPDHPKYLNKVTETV